MDAVNADAPVVPVAQPPKKKYTKWEKLKIRAKEEPVVFGFLGLTVAALTGGLISLYRDNKRHSQIMMRARVLFQFCTVTALIGGVYYRQYAGKLDQPQGIRTDNRQYLTSPHPSTQTEASTPVEASNTVAAAEGAR